MIRQLLFQLRVALSELRGHTQKITPVVTNSIPYFSQFESESLIKKILDKKIPAEQDPLWKNSGAKNPREYAFWSWNSCGMACLKMVLFARTQKEYPIATLAKKCQTYGGYSKSATEGLIYAPFIQFVKKEFNLSCQVIAPMAIADVLKALDRGNLVIASVSPHIDTPQSSQDHTGGHLVLVTGYDLSKKQVTLHDPSGYTTKTRKNVVYSITHFKNFFAYRGITI